MDQFNSIKQLVCPLHKFSKSNLIHLTGESLQGRICSLCIAKKSIPILEILPIKELFAKKNDELLSTYPPFKSQQMRDLIEEYSQENPIQEKIDMFFEQLRSEVEEAFQLLEKRTKLQLIKYFQGQELLFQEINKMAECDKLKEKIISGNRKSLNQFLKQKWKSAERNEQTIQELIDLNQLPSLQFNFKEKQDQISKLISSLKNFSLFEGVDEQEELEPQANKIMKTTRNNQSNKFKLGNNVSIINTSNLIKSLYGDSKNLTISKKSDGTLQLMNNTTRYYEGQAFLDFILNPEIKYTIRINYQPKGNNSLFFFGVVSDDDKDTDPGFNVSNMSYCNQNSNHGITKSRKGKVIYEKKKQEKFEVIIYLKYKLIMMTSLFDPDYCLTLDDIKKIQSRGSYRFYMAICQEGDKIEIYEILELNENTNNEIIRIPS